ncbi:response regulator [Lentzea rhizosphaerae]|uniref:Response regulator n=1 Tax=Lentzea rhizosphaerae TaxID=2041025 RepID=A0ABV8C055_9PSEU
MRGRTVLVVDDHELVRTILVLALRTRGFDAHHVSATRKEDVLREAGEHAPGLVLLDLDLGREVAGGEQLVRPLRAAGWSVLIVTAGRDGPAVARAVADGAHGWVHKTESFEHLLHVVVAAAEGREVLSPAARAELVRLHQRDAARKKDLTTRLDRLSVREREVLDRLAEGRQAVTIADEFGVSLATVRAHIRSVLMKLQVGSQLAAVALVNEADRP